MTAGPAVQTIADLEALEALAPEWWGLWRRVPNATPFGTPAWLIPWWRHFHPGPLWAVAVRVERRLVGLAPFYLEEGPHGRRILPVGISLSDYCDVLLDPAFAQPAATAIVGMSRAGARSGTAGISRIFRPTPPRLASRSRPAATKSCRPRAPVRSSRWIPGWTESRRGSCASSAWRITASTGASAPRSSASSRTVRRVPAGTLPPARRALAKPR
jgi:CelD/BcsL family acetyltransferase involved in cellulose biosynthesis